MKKIFSIGIIFAMLSSLFVFSAHADGMTVSAGNASCAAGGSVSIPITLSGNTGFSDLGIEVGYDSTVLTLTKATEGQTGASFTPAQSLTADPYNMSWDSIRNDSFNGTLATLEFNIAQDAAPGNYPITVSYYKGRNGDYKNGSDVNYDENFSPLDISYVAGYVTVSGGENSISIDNVQNNGVLSFTAGLNSDESITGIVIAAVYGPNGAVIASQEYSAAAEIPFSFGNIQNAATIKVFWWDSKNSITPKADTETFTL